MLELKIGRIAAAFLSFHLALPSTVLRESEKYDCISCGIGGANWLSCPIFVVHAANDLATLSE